MSYLLSELINTFPYICLGEYQLERISAFTQFGNFTIFTVII